MKSFLRLVVLVVLLLGGAYVFYLHTPYGPSGETFVDIPAGAGSNGIASRLEAAGVIRSRYAFLLLRRLHGGVLHAGEYRFDHSTDLETVYGRIVRGDVYTRTLVIPEGFNLFDIAAAVQAAGLGSGADFLAAARRDTALIADLSPGAPSLEGYLFPDTYRFSRHTTADGMVAAMVRRFRQVAAQVGLSAGPGDTGGRGQAGSMGSVARTVTLASLIEKEVRLDSERALVAGVFENRIAQGIPLATDPSVIYAALLEGRWRGTIYRSDLQADSPYNTYRHPGLPPSPIANPGVAALKAALSPAHTGFLYFVADAHGNTRFSVDLKSHNEQVQAYREAARGQP